MTYGEVIGFRASVDRFGIRPCCAAVIADGITAFFGQRILFADVMTVGGVELAIVPRQTDAVEPLIAVDLGLPLLDDVELGFLQHFDLRSFWQCQCVIPTARNGSELPEVREALRQAGRARPFLLP